MDDNDLSLVLIVTPNPALASSLRTALEARCCKVTTSSGVIDAIAELHGVEFDLLIVALTLPPRSGVDLVRVAREISPDTEVVVLLDASSSQTSIVDSVRYGAEDFLHQPIECEELDSVLERSRARCEARRSTTMFQTSHAILSGTNGKELPTLIVGLAGERLAADNVTFVHCAPPDSDVASSSSASSPSSEIHALVSAAVRDGHFSKGMPLLLPDDADLLLGSDPNARIRSAILCPISIEGRLVGVLAAQRSHDPRPFRRSDADSAGIFGAHLRLALDNVRLLEKTVSSERLAAIGELAAGVAHEINSPLMYVLENCDFALREVTQLLAPGSARGADIRQALGDVKEGAERIREIANDLRTLARGTGIVESVDINDTVRSALRISAATVRGAVVVTTSFGESVRVLGNPGRVCQVFVNLLVNAAQAAHTKHVSIRPGGRRPERPTVAIETRREDNRVRIIIRDTGPGIAPEHLDRIFETFYTTKASSGGTGLGLSITRAIVVDHGGTITVASTLGEGTTFTIDLPAADSASKQNAA